jgi:hypothetical protein
MMLKRIALAVLLVGGSAWPAAVQNLPPRPQPRVIAPAPVVPAAPPEVSGAPTAPMVMPAGAPSAATRAPASSSGPANPGQGLRLMVAPTAPTPTAVAAPPPAASGPALIAPAMPQAGITVPVVALPAVAPAAGSVRSAVAPAPAPAAMRTAARGRGARDAAGSAASEEYLVYDTGVPCGESESCGRWVVRNPETGERWSVRNIDITGLRLPPVQVQLLAQDLADGRFVVQGTVEGGNRAAALEQPPPARRRRGGGGGRLDAPVGEVMRVTRLVRVAPGTIATRSGLAGGP